MRVINYREFGLLAQAYTYRSIINPAASILVSPSR